MPAGKRRGFLGIAGAAALAVVLAISCTKDVWQVVPFIDVPGPESNWPLLPSFPIQCLRKKECDYSSDATHLEIGSVEVEDWNGLMADSAPTPRDPAKKRTARLGAASRVDFSEIDPELKGVMVDAYKSARDAQNPEGKYQTSVSESLAGSPPQLPPRPRSYVDIVDAYRSSNAFLTCETASEAVDLARDRQTLTPRKHDKLLAAVYTRYVAGCFISAPNDIRDRLAIFWTHWPGVPSLGVYCLGFAIDGKHVLTAKHCLTDPSALSLARTDKKLGQVALQNVPGSRISFANALGRSFAYHVSELHSRSNDVIFDPSDPGDDIGLVELESDRNLPPIVISASAPWSLVNTFTSFISIELIDRCIRDQNQVGCDGSNLIRMDDAPTCVVPTLKNTCLLHACQTRSGASGGPILKRDTAKIELLGVHTGSIDDPNKAPCGLPRGDFYPNYGIFANTAKVVTEWQRTQTKN